MSVTARSQSQTPNDPDSIDFDDLGNDDDLDLGGQW
jgi:hypothetical protein